jgi:hypothetical protein
MLERGPLAPYLRLLIVYVLQALFSCNLVFQKKSEIFDIRKMEDYVQQEGFNARDDFSFF